LKRNFEEFRRFVLVGATNSILTYLIYLALLGVVGYAVAYTISYACGIAFSYVANSVAVFKAPMNAKSALRFPLVYAFQYLAGLGLMWLQIDVLGVPAWLAPWVATAILLPLTFLLTRRFLRGRADTPGSEGAR